MRLDKTPILRSRYILVVVLANYLVLGLFRIQENRDMFHTDQEVFLQNAYKYQDAPLWAKLLPPVHMASVSSTLHPVMPYLLYPLARDMRDFYPRAKLVNLACGLLCLIALNLLVSSHYGALPGLFATLLLSTNSIFIKVSTRLSSEPLLLVFVVCWLYWSARCFRRTEKAGNGAKVPWILAGVFSGLAYLSKPTGLLVPCLFVLFCLARLRELSPKRFTFYLIALFLTISPLMLSNLKGNTSPFYNVNFFHLLSLSAPSDFTAEDLEQTGAWNIVKSIDGSEFASQWARNSLSFLDQLLRFLSPVSMPQGISFPLQQAARVLGAVLVLSSVVFVLLSSRRAPLISIVFMFFVLYTGCMVPAFSVNPSPRFLLPDILMISILLGAFSAKFSMSEPWVGLAIGALALGSMGSRLMRDTIVNPFQTNDQSVDYFLDWAESNEGEFDEKVRLAFYEHDSWLVDMMKKNELLFASEPINNDVEKFSELLGLLESRDVDYLLVSASLFYDGNPVLEDFEPFEDCRNRGNTARNMSPYAELYEEGLSECGYLAIYRIGR